MIHQIYIIGGKFIMERDLEISPASKVSDIPIAAMLANDGSQNC